MTTAAKSTFKTQLQYGDAGSPEGFTTIAELTSIEPGEQTAEMLDATSHDSPAAESIPAGIVDYGTHSATGNLIADATQEAVRAKLGGAASNWQLCLPDYGVRTATFTVVAATNVCTAVAHGLTTGQPIRATSSTTLPAGLAINTTYWVRKIDADTFTLHSTNAGAVANTGVIDITDTGTGTHTLQIGTRADFAGLVSSWRPSAAPVRGVQQMTMQLRVTGTQTTTT